MGVHQGVAIDTQEIIMPRQGLQAFDPLVFRGLDNMEFADRIAAKINSWKPDAVFIDSGQGAGVIDRLRQMGYSVIEVNFGGKANDPHFVNRRTEMWFRMAEAIVQGLAIPNDNSLKLELATPTYRFDVQNRIALESKDDIKKRMPEWASPDIADSLALTYAAPVAKASVVPHRNAARDYDPYALK